MRFCVLIEEPIESPTRWLRRDGVRMGELLLAWVIVTGALVGVGQAVVGSPGVNMFDRHATSIIVTHRSPALDAVMKTVTWLGSSVALLVTAGLILIVCGRRILPWFALLLAVIAWVGETSGVTIAKQLVARHRPPQHFWVVSARGWSWPSGHAATAVLVVTILATTVQALLKRPALRAVAWTAAVLAILAVAFSRVELGVHWTTDVVASMIYVTTWLVVLNIIGRSLSH